MVDAVNAFVFDGRNVCPAFAFDKSGQAALRIGLADAYAHRHNVRLVFMAVFRPRNDDDVGFGRQEFFRVYRSPVFNVRRGDIVAACCVGNRAPHIFAEGVAVFGRAFVAELDIDFRFGLLGARDAFLDVGNASGVFGGNFLGARLRTVEFAENFRTARVPRDGFGVEIDHDDGYACRFNARQMGGDGLILPVGQNQYVRLERERFLQ